jgi:hypothetical protein
MNQTQDDVKVAEATFDGNIVNCKLGIIDAVGQRNAPPSQPNVPGAISYSGGVSGENANNLPNLAFNDFNGRPYPTYGGGWNRNTRATSVEVPPDTEVVFYGYGFHYEHDNTGPIRIYESYQMLQNKNGGASLS